MRSIANLTILASSILLVSCIHKGTNPDDPYESINREIHKFNMAFDATMLKPPAKFYKKVIPAPIRAGINNFYDNINMIPTFANHLLQAQWHDAQDDAGRFLVNSSIGLAGFIDVATINNIPLHKTDLGVTFAKWGNKKSTYIVIPFLGPSTIRDGIGMGLEYTFLTPYPYIENEVVLNSLIGLRYIDLRSQLFETERLMNEALDKYSFIRDAYLQHRAFLITGEKTPSDTASSLFIEEAGSDYIDE